jgi:hypothetical protein
MILKQSSVTGVAQQPSINPKSTTGMSSPSMFLNVLLGRLAKASQAGVLRPGATRARQMLLSSFAPFVPLRLCVRGWAWDSPHVPLWMTRQPTNPHPKSTPAYPKSTVDLGCELLIWGKNTTQTSLLLGLQHSFGSIMTRPIAKSNQNRPKIFSSPLRHDHQVVPAYARCPLHT